MVPRYLKLLRCLLAWLVGGEKEEAYYSKFEGKKRLHFPSTSTTTVEDLFFLPEDDRAWNVNELLLLLLLLLLFSFLQQSC